MSAQSDSGCSASHAAASHEPPPGEPPAVITDSGQGAQGPCPSSSAANSPSRSEQADTRTAQHDQPRKGRKRKGPSGVYARLKGREVDVPGCIFGVDVPELYYRGRVLGKDAAHSGCVILRTEDGSRYFFPVSEVTAWMDDMQHRSSPRPGSTLGTACDRFAAETLQSMSMSLSTAAVSEGSAGEDDAGTPARTTLLRVQAQAAARRALLPLPHHGGQEAEEEEEEEQGRQQQQQQLAAGSKRRQRQQQQQQQQEQGEGKQGGRAGPPVVVVDASGMLLQGVALGQHEVAGKGPVGELVKRKRGAASRGKGVLAAVERVDDSEAGRQRGAAV